MAITDATIQWRRQVLCTAPTAGGACKVELFMKDKYNQTCPPSSASTVVPSSSCAPIMFNGEMAFLPQVHGVDDGLRV